MTEYKTFENKIIDLFKENDKIVTKLEINMKKGIYKIYFKQE